LKIETSLERAYRTRKCIWTTLQFLFIQKLKIELHEVLIYSV